MSRAPKKFSQLTNLESSSEVEIDNTDVGGCVLQKFDLKNPKHLNYKIQTKKSLETKLFFMRLKIIQSLNWIQYGIVIWMMMILVVREWVDQVGGLEAPLCIKIVYRPWNPSRGLHLCDNVGYSSEMW